mgnify:CR=1 FL=1
MGCARVSFVADYRIAPCGYVAVVSTSLVLVQILLVEWGWLNGDGMSLGVLD